jgi:hypothetical protein
MKDEIMNTNDKCKNCGGDHGIHHYQTNQCPVGGSEAPIDRKQEYMTTTFESENSDELEELREMVKKLIARVEELEEIVSIRKAG